MLATSIPGWMSEIELAWIARQAALANVIVEVGVWKGRSTACWCEHTTGVVFAVDDYHPELTGCQAYQEAYERGGAAIRDEALANLLVFRAMGKLFLIEQASDVAARNALTDVLRYRPADVVFLDGNHQAIAVCEDVILYRPLLRPGGLLCGHDYPEVCAGLKMAGLQGIQTDPATAGSIWWVQV